jgi:hypothetical protein
VPVLMTWFDAIAVVWRPLGLHPLVLAAVCLAVGCGLTAHALMRSATAAPHEDSGSPPARLGRLATSSIVITRHPPFLRIAPGRESSDRYLGRVDKELYWGVALLVAGLGALLASF